MVPFRPLRLDAIRLQNIAVTSRLHPHFAFLATARRLDLDGALAVLLRPLLAAAACPGCPGRELAVRGAASPARRGRALPQLGHAIFTG